MEPIKESERERDIYIYTVKKKDSHSYFDLFQFT